MKKNIFLLFLISVTLFSCSDKETQSIVDCFGESFLVDVHHEVSTANPLQVNFNVSYGGDHTVDGTMKWDYGDGINQTNTGVTAAHTYAKSGTYTVIAKVGLNNGGCSFDIKEKVTIPSN